jgi:NitT/TauT family transport system permease protein
MPTSTDVARRIEHIPATAPAKAAPRRRPGRLARYLTLKRSRPLTLPVITALLAFGAWELIVEVAEIPHVIMPPPSEVFEKLFKFLPFIAQNAIPTAWESTAGFLLAVVLGVALAILLIYSRFLFEALYPNLVFFQLIPKIALAPLFIVWLGIGFESRLTFSLFISFFPMLIATAAGLSHVDRDMIRLCRSFGATDWQIMMNVRLPTSMPFIFSGMKISVTLAIIGVVIGEFISSQAGLGYLILFASSRQETALTLAAILMLCVVGLVLYAIVAVAEQFARRHYGDGTSTNLIV